VVFPGVREAQAFLKTFLGDSAIALRCASANAAVVSANALFAASAKGHTFCTGENGDCGELANRGGFTLEIGVSENTGGVRLGNPGN
jgi:hypothetical protein